MKEQTKKVNPSASYIGFEISGSEPKSVNYRQGKKNVLEILSVKCTAANATGRRLNCIFTLPDNSTVERRVYKEYFEKMAKVFEVLLPE